MQKQRDANSHGRTVYGGNENLEAISLLREFNINVNVPLCT